jgi:hypothetical protein
MAINQAVTQSYTQPTWNLIDSYSSSSSTANIYLYNAAQIPYRTYRLLGFGLSTTGSGQLCLEINNNATAIYNSIADCTYSNPSFGMYNVANMAATRFNFNQLYTSLSNQRHIDYYIDNAMITAPKFIRGKTNYYTGSAYATENITGQINDYNNITSLRVFSSSGSVNFANSSFGLYLLGAY